MSAGDVRRHHRARVGLHLACSCTCRSARTTSPPAWNAAQVLVGPQLALGANSPYFFGKQLWAETRTELFLQADRHPLGGAEEPGRPAAGLLRRALDHLDLRPVRGERALLPGPAAGVDRRGPGRGARGRRRPSPAGAAAAQRHGLPLEPPDLRHGQRDARTCGSRTACCRPVPPSWMPWPTRCSTTASIKVLSEEDRPVWTKMSFDAARHNFTEGARRGIESSLYWPGFGELPADELRPAPPAAAGPRGSAAVGGLGAAVDRYLGIIEERCTGNVNGASWQIGAVTALRGARC